MEPGAEFWAEAAKNAPSGLVAVLIAVVAVLFVVVRWGLPLVKELRIKRLEIDRYRIEVDDRAARQLDDRERERIRVTQQQIEQQRESNESLRALTSAVAASTAHTDVLVEELHGARDRSREMGGDVKDMHGKIDEMHAVIVRKEMRHE